jgi:hypothetical protein
MVLTMSEKQTITRELADRYRRAGRKAKGAILDQGGRSDRLQSVLRHPGAAGLWPASAV